MNIFRCFNSSYVLEGLWRVGESVDMIIVLCSCCCLEIMHFIFDFELFKHTHLEQFNSGSHLVLQPRSCPPRACAELDVAFLSRLTQTHPFYPD